MEFSILESIVLIRAIIVFQSGICHAEVLEAFSNTDFTKQFIVTYSLGVSKWSFQILESKVFVRAIIVFQSGICHAEVLEALIILNFQNNLTIRIFSLR